MAAQTSRDRKKAKMEQMETALQELFTKNETLLAECENLRFANQKLQEENAELCNRLRIPCANCSSSSESQSRPVECGSESGSAESLLRPKGTRPHSAASLTKLPPQMAQAFWKMVLACLLYQTCSTSSTTTSTSLLLNNSLRACSKISPETWKVLLKKQILK